MKPERKIRGHFGLVYPQNTPNNTTVTTRRKSKAREKEAAKKAQLLREIQELTGAPVSSYARSYDGVTRRYTGIKGNGPDR